MKILEDIKFNLRPEPLNFLQELIKKINNTAEKYNANCMVGGSYAKGTNLKGDFDVDLFMKFDKEETDENLSNYTEEILKKLNIKYLRVHGSRDYFQFKIKKVNFELIPVLNISKISQMKNITDVSPFHVGYITSKLKKNPKIVDEIRLTKQFMKANKVYGAESYIKGFSGHVVDLLIVYYHSFLKLIEQAREWTPKVVIDIEKKQSNPLKLNKEKISSPLIVIDPIQPERNAAAALSMKKFNQFRQAAENFLEKPSKDFFEVKKLDYKKFLKENKKGKNAIIKIEPLKLSKDVSGSKIMKLVDFLKRELKENNFEIYNLEWEFSPETIICISASLISQKKLVEGPPLKQKKDCLKFKLKRKNTFTKNKRLYAYEIVKYPTLKNFLKEKLNESYAKEKFVKIKNII